MLTFHSTQQWSEGEIHVKWVESTRPHILEVEAAIEKAWNDAMSRPGVHLFDGPMCRLEHWDARPGRLDLHFSPTSYKPFLGTNLFNPSFADRFGPHVLANPIGASTALESADGFLLMGRRTANVAFYPSRVHPFAGSIEPADGADVFNAVRRELAEEVQLRAGDIASMSCIGVVEDHLLKQRELIFSVRSHRTAAEIESRMNREEHHAIYVIKGKENAVAHAIHDPELTPLGVASLLLWGRPHFGESWFTRNGAAHVDSF